VELNGMNYTRKGCFFLWFFGAVREHSLELNGMKKTRGIVFLQHGLWSLMVQKDPCMVVVFEYGT
jgi:hypothetical protein